MNFVFIKLNNYTDGNSTVNDYSELFFRVRFKEKNIVLFEFQKIYQYFSFKLAISRGA